MAKARAQSPSRAFGGGADNVAFSDIRHIKPDTEDMLQYVLGLRPPDEQAPSAEQAATEDDWDGPPDGADPVAATAMRIQQLEGLVERLQAQNEETMEGVAALRKVVNQKEKALQKLQKQEEQMNKEIEEGDKLVEERTARHNNNIDEKKRLEAEVAELSTKREKLRIKCGVGVGGANAGGAATFDRVFESDDPAVRGEAAEAKHEVVSFEQIHGSRMPGWLEPRAAEAAGAAAAAGATGVVDEAEMAHISLVEDSDVELDGGGGGGGVTGAGGGLGASLSAKASSTRLPPISPLKGSRPQT